MKISRILAATAVLALGSVNAQAAWILVSDPNLSDSATNPDFDVANQNATTVASWLQDLMDLPSAPTVSSQGDLADGTASIGGLGAGLLALHYGGGGLFGYPSSGGYDLAFSCSVSCATIDLATGGYSKAISNYRFYGSTSVPEPTTLALMGLGLVGLGFMRRRRAA